MGQPKHIKSDGVVHVSRVQVYNVSRHAKVILKTHRLRVHKAKEQNVLPHGLSWGAGVHPLGVEKAGFNSQKEVSEVSTSVKRNVPLPQKSFRMPQTRMAKGRSAGAKEIPWRMAPNEAQCTRVKRTKGHMRCVLRLVAVGSMGCFF